jgi:hypothetical protein
MSLNSSGPTTAATVGEARKSDQLGSSIASENNVSAATVKFHPLADMFPLMEGEEFDALVADIKANGVQQHIVLYRGKILDGRNRYRAMLALEYKDEFIKAECKPLYEVLGYATASDLPEDEALKWVISANLHRRHLTAEQKRELIAKLIEAQPEKSDRELAKQAKVSHPTIAKARKQAEATGKALPVEKRVGADGKARKQPAKKKRSADAEQEGADKKECIALWQKVQRAEREAERPAPARVKRTDGTARKQPSWAEQILDLVKATIGMFDREIDHGLISIEDAESTAQSAATAWTLLAERLHARQKAIPAAAGEPASGDNSNDAEASATQRKAEHAAIDDGSDPGPIPESLRRDRVQP